MSTVAEINEAIEKLDVPDQMRLLQDLHQHLKFQPGDAAQTAACYADADWAVFENGCGKASD